ncbi:MAG: hypothetical protein IJ126_08355 [Lachnospiraceae bacterium]|nr:hypothetical protein [Lachnospiraceae bacterium]
MDKKEQYKYIQQYKKKNYARIVLELKPEEKEKWKEAAAAENKSLQSYIKDAVNAEIEKKEN